MMLAVIATGEDRRMSEELFKQYRRSAIAEMADWHEGFDMSRVSVSAADAEAGSPKAGDKIARNPKNHDDRWLVAAAYFAENFEELTANVAVPHAAALQEARMAGAGAGDAYARLLIAGADAEVAAMRRRAEVAEAEVVALRDDNERLRARMTEFAEWCEIPGVAQRDFNILADRLRRAAEPPAASRPVPAARDSRLDPIGPSPQQRIEALDGVAGETLAHVTLPAPSGDSDARQRLISAIDQDNEDVDSAVLADALDAFEAAIRAESAAALQEARDRLTAFETAALAVDAALTPWLHGDRIDPVEMVRAMAVLMGYTASPPPAAAPPAQEEGRA